jgi:amino acid adenylation domain-containing protein/thioester reductase-like protein
MRSGDHNGVASFPLSFSQQRLWFFEQLIPNTAVYNMYVTFELTGVLNAEALERSVNFLMNRHQAFKMSFDVVEDKPTLLIADNSSIKLEWVDLSNTHSDQDQLKRAYEFVGQYISHPFDLKKPPLFRVHPIKFSENKCWITLVMHHLIADGWSLGVLLREMTECYNAFAEARPLALKPLTIDYTDYISWQLQYADEQKLQPYLNYWKQYLTKDMPLVQLPYDRPLALYSRFIGKRTAVLINAQQTTGLKQLAIKNRATLFMVLLAALKTVLYRYTRQDDIAIGTPVANRNRKELEGLMGLFVNTLVLRSTIDGKQAFNELVKQIKVLAQGAYQYQDLPFEKLVAELQPERQASGTPLFNVMFVLQNMPLNPVEFCNVNAQVIPVHNHTCKFDLLLTLTEWQGQVQGAFEYNAELFEEATINGLRDHFSFLLDHIINDAETPLDKIPLLSANERDELVAAKIFAPPVAAETVNLCSLFEQSVVQFPNAIAVNDAQSKIEYKTLNEQANQLAHFLVAKGVKVGDLVALSLFPSIAVIVSVIAILKTGAAYVPVDPLSPEDRVDYILKDATAKLIISHSDLLKQLPSEHVIRIDLDVVHKELSQYPTANLRLSVQSTERAYIIYTSGSTGRPKGVQVTHHNVLRLLSSTQQWYQFNQQDVWTLFHSYAFDFSVWEIWGALAYGGRLVVIASDIKRDIRAFFKLLLDEKVTVLNQTPSVFRQFADIALEATQPLLTSLRFIIFGGEKLDIQSLRPWFDRYGDQHPRLINMYGITETTVHVSYRPINVDDIGQALSPIGNAIPDLQIYLLDHCLEPVPYGAIGEMYVGGAGVALGYLKRPELTQERFIKNLFNNPYAPVLYKTGDIARYKANGELEYCGRSDQQVKIRGFRIETSEIEYWLEQHPAIKQAVVRACTTQETVQLVAYLLLDQEAYQNSMQEFSSGVSDQQLQQWNTVFDDYYHSGERKEVDFNIVGWLSSYTRSAIPDHEMLEWVNNTVERLLQLKANAVLELGCGTGLLLKRIAPSANLYYASDFSISAIQFLRDRLLQSDHQLAHIKLWHQSADQVETFGNVRFDLIILNSVIQYFPSRAYLQTVLVNAVSKLSTTGKLFLGDLRNLQLVRLFHSSVVLYQLTSNLPLSSLKQLIKTRVDEDTELLLTPQFLYQFAMQLPGVTHIELLHKVGQHRNEMNDFRFDAVLYFNAHNVVHINKYFTWNNDISSLEEVAELLSQLPADQVLAVRQIPNARLLQYQKQDELIFEQGNTIEYTDQLKENLNAHDWKNMGVDPSQLYELAQQHGRVVRLLLDETHLGYLTAVFVTNDAAHLPLQICALVNKQSLVVQDSAALTSSPTNIIINKLFLPQLRSFLNKYLMDYMIPSHFIYIDQIPLTVNGKIDEHKLPQPLLEGVGKSNIHELPQTEIEKKIAMAFSQVLSVPNIGRHDNFFHLGGHSLLATKLMMQLRAIFDCEIPLRLILLKPELSNLALAIENFIKGEAIDAVFSVSADLPKDTILPGFINVPEYLPYASAENAILLTGATGFVGAFLLNALLQQTKASIYCLVRAQDEVAAFNLIVNNLKRYLLWDERYASRIKIIMGDLAKEKLGLSQQQFSELAKEIDVIYHNGAMVNFVYPYSALKSSNVDGTIALLALSCTHKLKPFHFISTLYVFSDQDYQYVGKLNEHRVPQYWQSLAMGYTQSKWVAEHLLYQAKQKGLPVSIYRLGRIIGSSKTGACQIKDFLWELTRVGIQMHCLPEARSKMNLTPVDYAADSIVSIARGTAAKATDFVYHIMHPSDIHFENYIQLLREAGYNIALQSLSKWQQQAVAEAAGNEQHPAYSLLPLLENNLGSTGSICFDGTYTQSILTQIGMVCPEINAVIRKTIAYFQKTTYFPTSGESIS